MRLAKTLAFTTLAAVAAAQNPILVNAAGTPFAVGTVAFPPEPPTTYTSPLALAPNGQVYLALDPSVPSGYYSFDVLDVYFNSLSQLPPEERVFYAQNNGAAGFALTRVVITPTQPAFGLGLGGVGQSMPVFPYNAPPLVAGRPDLTCVQKVWLQSLGSSPTGVPTLIGLHHFRAGDGSPGSVSGVVFEDSDHDGIRDAGEPGVPGCLIKLVSNNPANPGQVVATTTTDASGHYVFSPLANGDFSVVLDLNTQIFVATTPTDVHLSNCGCGQQVVDFGKYSLGQSCNGRTPGFWRNNNGVPIIVNGQFWDELAALNLVDGSGNAFNPTGNVNQWKSWLQNANATNMAYMLSVHLACMQLNVLSGGVSGNCWAQTPQGAMQISAVMAAANQALALDPYTPAGDPNRATQEFLKNILDAANNNLNWL